MQNPFQLISHTLLSLAALFGLVWGAIVFVRGENQQATSPIERRLQRVEGHVERIPRIEANQEVMLRQLGVLQKNTSQPQHKESHAYQPPF